MEIQSNVRNVQYNTRFLSILLVYAKRIHQVNKKNDIYNLTKFETARGTDKYNFHFNINESHINHFDNSLHYFVNN